MKKININNIILVSILIVGLLSFTSCDVNGADETISSKAEEAVADSADSIAESVDSSVEAKNFTLEELAEFNGKDGNPAYVAVDGVVYDVTDIPGWSGGEHNGNLAGTDVTEAIKRAPHGTSKLNDLPIVGKIGG